MNQKQGKLLSPGLQRHVTLSLSLSLSVSLSLSRVNNGRYHKFS